MTVCCWQRVVRPRPMSGRHGVLDATSRTISSILFEIEVSLSRVSGSRREGLRHTMRPSTWELADRAPSQTLASSGDRSWRSGEKATTCAYPWQLCSAPRRRKDSSGRRRTVVPKQLEAPQKHQQVVVMPVFALLYDEISTHIGRERRGFGKITTECQWSIPCPVCAVPPHMVETVVPPQRIVHGTKPA